MGEKSYAIFVGPNGKALAEAIETIDLNGYALQEIRNSVTQWRHIDNGDALELIEALESILDVYHETTIQVAGEIYP